MYVHVIEWKTLDGLAALLFLPKSLSAHGTLVNEVHLYLHKYLNKYLCKYLCKSKNSVLRNYEKTE